MPLEGLPGDDVLLVYVFILLVPLADEGLSLINTGLGRSHSADKVMLASGVRFACPQRRYFFIWIASRVHKLACATRCDGGGKPWNWIRCAALFFSPTCSLTARLVNGGGLRCQVGGLAALSPLRRGIERWRLSASCLSTVLLEEGRIPYLPLGVGGGGGLAGAEGVNLWTRGQGFIDRRRFAGNIQGRLAWTGSLPLPGSWVPRRGKYSMMEPRSYSLP